MSNESITYIVAITAGTFSLAGYVGLILVPVWQSYSRAWERVVASLLSLYLLAAFVAVGAGGGLAIIWFWDRIQP